MIKIDVGKENEENKKKLRVMKIDDERENVDNRVENESESRRKKNSITKDKERETNKKKTSHKLEIRNDRKCGRKIKWKQSTAERVRRIKENKRERERITKESGK